MAFTKFVFTAQPCGSGPAREEAGTVAIKFKMHRIYALTCPQVKPLHNFTQHQQSFTATLAVAQ
jgi:hypothetical protein